MLRTPGRRDDFLKSVAATGCLACSGYLAPALTSAIINSREINLAGAIELSGLTFLLMWVAGCWLLQLSGRQGPRLRIACVLLALICVINSSVFLWDFGPFDGRQIALFNHLPKVLAEVGALAMIALIAKFFHASIGSRVLSLSVAVALMSFAPLIDQLRGIRRAVGAYLDSSSVVFDFSDESILSLSPEKNVLVFVVDALQTDYLVRSFANHPDLAAAFTGFTVFTNNAGTAPNTTYSVPAMLSGIPYSGDEDGFRYRAAALGGRTSLPVILGAHGYDVRLFAHNSIPYDPGVAVWENVGRRNWSASAVTGWLSLTRLSLYRVLPTPLRLPLRDDTVFGRVAAVARSAGRTPLADSMDDRGLLSAFAKRIRASSPEPAFRWFHLHGIHEPLSLVSAEERSRIGTTGAQAAQLQVDRFMRMFADMLLALEAAKIYDSATVAVVGDHGLDDTRMPALMVKPAHARHAMALSDAPSSNADLPATVLALLGIESATGANAFRLTSSAPRVRRFFEFYALDPSNGRPTVLTEHTLEVRDNRRENWRREQARHPGLEADSVAEVMAFTGGASIDVQLVRGHYTRGTAGIHWSQWIEIDVLTPSNGSVLAEFLYYRYGTGPATVIPFVNGERRPELTTAPHGRFRLLVSANPQAQGRSARSTIRFAFPPSSTVESLLLVELVSTKLRGVESHLLRPARTGVSCVGNAVWGVGGTLWQEKPRLLTVMDEAVMDVEVDEASETYTFVAPPGRLATPASYRLIDLSTASIGPELSSGAACLGS
jgi:hypothetical protein